MAGYYGNIKRKLLIDTMSEVTGIIRLRKFRKMYITMPEHLYITKRTSKRYYQKKFEADEESHYQKH